MTFPASFWSSLAFLILTAMLCRRWPVLALQAATGAFCLVGQALLLQLPECGPIVFADTVLFVLPTVPLVSACGSSGMRTASVFLIVPLALSAHVYAGSEARAVVLPIAISFVQGMVAISGISNRTWRAVSFEGMQRWAGTCIAAIGPIGIGFAPVWNDVAWTGVAAYAFACLAYLVHEHEK